MSKKDLSAVTTNLAALAGQMPSQHVQDRKETSLPDNTERVPKEADTGQKAVRTRADSGGGEATVQFSFSLRKSQRKDLARLAAERDMTVRSFILEALRAQGLPVTDDDLRDLRRRDR